MIAARGGGWRPANLAGQFVAADSGSGCAWLGIGVGQQGRQSKNDQVIPYSVCDYPMLFDRAGFYVFSRPGEPQLPGTNPNEGVAL